jgi:chemosensory pili system protein ChpA (sensor histidine kinase/response regulator)
LSSLPPCLKQIHGALSIIGFDRAAEIQSICNRLIAKCASSDPAWIEGDMDTIVEGLSSIGFFLDPCLRGMAPMESALDAFFERLALRNAPPAADTVAPTESAPRKPEPIVDQRIPVSVDRTVEPQEAPAQITAVADELLDIFLEEAGEVLVAIGDALPVCRSNMQDMDALTTIRRSFHTLKGSGRMVGLNDLGETAWEIEQVMNHWLERQWSATPALLELIELATRSFTTWVSQLTARQPLTIEAQQLLDMAVALKNTTSPGPAAPSATPPAAAVAAPPASEPEPEPELNDIAIGPVHVSRMFFDIYRKEAQQHLSTLRTEIDVWSNAPGSAASSQLERAAHTLASISRTAELTPLAELAMRLEQCLPNARHIIQADDLLLLRQSVTALDTMLADVAQQRYPDAAAELVTGLDALIERLQSPRESDTQPAVIDAPAPTPPEAEATVLESFIEPIDDDALVRAAATRTSQEQRLIRDDLDPDLLPIFLEEALELLPQISRDLRDWITNPADPQIPQALQRALHTLKGGARMAGAMRLGELTHLMESRLEAAIASGIPVPVLLEDIEAHVDRLSEGVERLRVHDTPTLTPTPDEPVAAKPADLPLHPDGPQQGPAMLRIPADTLDRLINEAGEVGIARTRIEGELRNIRQSLSELNDSMVRLKGQLREIEVQADSQMQSRQSVMATNRPEFDPLEFDRYTRLQELTRMMSESLHDVTTVQQALLRNVGEVDAAVLQQARGNRELQQGLMRTRTVPFSNLDERLYRIARQTARELGKKINLEINDSHTELDRSVLERISAPLEHLLRNAIGHGIEAAEARQAAGKPETGEISISLRQESNEIAIIIRDDGAGLDLAKLRTQGLAQGLLDPQQDASEEELKALIFAPGLSTATTITEVSGRGVGMDVVRNEVTAIGGHIETLSTAGKGMTFSIFLPLTLAVTQAVLVRSATGNFAISSTMVEQVLSLQPAQLEAARQHGSIEDRGQSYPLHFLQQLLGYPAPVAATQGYSPILLLRSGLQRIALHVDELTRNQEIVIKNINPHLARIPGVTGATVLGDGRVVLIINPVHLTHRMPSVISETEPALLPEAIAPALPLVMVVDDSLTVRKITGRLLEREGYQVITAKDGLDALEQMNGILPDALLVDIEMPRMDGFDFSTRIREDARTAAIPIIIISSRTADKHRNRARQIGVNAFLGKPYQESELLAQIAEYVKPVAVAQETAPH